MNENVVRHIESFPLIRSIFRVFGDLLKFRDFFEFEGEWLQRTQTLLQIIYQSNRNNLKISLKNLKISA